MFCINFLKEKKPAFQVDFFMKNKYENNIKKVKGIIKKKLISSQNDENYISIEISKAFT